MSSLLDRIEASDSVKQLLGRLAEGGALSAEGLWGSSAPILAAAVHRALNRPILYVTAHIDDADQAQDDLELVLNRPCEVIPAWESLPPADLGADEIAGERARICCELAEGRSDNPPVLAAPIQALIHPVPAPQVLVKDSISLKVGQEYDIEALVRWLADHGFERLDQVEQGGDFAVRGGIVDVYGGGYDSPVRIEFFGQQVESIRRFDPATQRSQADLKQFNLAPLTTVADLGPQQTCNLLQYLPPETILILHEPVEIAELARSFLTRVPDPVGLYPFEAIHSQAGRFTQLHIARFGAAAVQQRFRFRFEAPPRFEHEPADVIDQIRQLADRYQLLLFCETAGQRQRFEQFLAEHDAGKLPIMFELGLLHRGFLWPDENLAVLTHHEIFHRYEQPRRLRKAAPATPTESFAEIEPGDYVVHVQHGIGKFEGLKLMRRGDGKAEFLTIRFANKALVHVPASDIHLVQKYLGGFRGHPPLSRLGSSTWNRTKQRVSQAVTSLAEELLEIQARREAMPGIEYPADTQWQRQFEDSFIYDETEDQLLALRDIKQDMGKHRPMDRLLCGDVGYGKTELAVRAAFKAVEAGYQVAVLVPTTVLAEQHYRTFTQRLADFPFKVEVINRFRTMGEQARILSETAGGRIDILIGTHRLLSEDVRFANLGLVVIDEEQRFGVEHKERLKRLRATVDVLTMTATPIPRTLHMSLVGLREISTLATPPLDRRAIHTEVQYYDPQLIRQAILRELNRDGQVYFLHNRVQNIEAVTRHIQQLVPEARIRFGHGQMKGRQLEDVMFDFVRRKFDVLVCTTIIESGLDIPTVNTIIINDADRFGLAELHQLRGRVGRYKYRAYAYLLIPRDRPITPNAARRLRAIEEYSELGAGFRIAMRDLEIRGAGNILGPQQSGHIAAVGYEMYCQLLSNAVRRLKHQVQAAPVRTHIELNVSGYVPRSYIASDRQRMEVYRRLAHAACQADLEQLADDLRDIFGPIPPQTRTLMDLTELRILAGRWKIASMILQNSDVVFTLTDPPHAKDLFADVPGTVRFAEPRVVHLRMPKRYLEPPTLLAVLRKILDNTYRNQGR